MKIAYGIDQLYACTVTDYFGLGAFLVYVE